MAKSLFFSSTKYYISARLNWILKWIEFNSKKIYYPSYSTHLSRICYKPNAPPLDSRTRSFGLSVSSEFSESCFFDLSLRSSFGDSAKPVSERHWCSRSRTIYSDGCRRRALASGCLSRKTTRTTSWWTRLEWSRPVRYSATNRPGCVTWRASFSTRRTQLASPSTWNGWVARDSSLSNTEPVSSGTRRGRECVWWPAKRSEYLPFYLWTIETNRSIAD